MATWIDGFRKYYSELVLDTNPWLHAVAIEQLGNLEYAEDVPQSDPGYEDWYYDWVEWLRHEQSYRSDTGDAALRARAEYAYKLLLSMPRYALASASMDNLMEALLQALRMEYGHLHYCMSCCSYYAADTTCSVNYGSENGCDARDFAETAYCSRCSGDLEPEDMAHLMALINNQNS